jgi:predicted NBD/HSP70 family sugar kinase
VSDLRSALNCPIYVGNDCEAAGVGEGVYGLGQGREFVFLIWGTGIGGVHIKSNAQREKSKEEVSKFHKPSGTALSVEVSKQEEKILKLNPAVGGMGNSETSKLSIEPFEPGHIIIDRDGPEDGCGQYGCWQRLASGGGIKQDTGKRASELTEAEWQDVLAVMAQGMVNLMAVRPVDLVVFGGGVAIKHPDKVAELQAMMKDYLQIYPVPEIKVTEFGDAVGLYGAVSLISAGR